MARIRPYESQVSSQGDLPAQRAGEGNFGGPGLIHVGQAVEDLGASAGQVKRFMLEQKQRQEVTDAAVEHAKLHTDLAADLDTRAKAWKPGDPPLSEEFTGVLKNRLDSLNGGDEGSRFETAGGADAARRHGAQTTQHFMALTRDMDAKLAGDAAATQHTAFVGARANFLQGHPANFALERDRLGAMIHDPSGLYGRLPDGAKAKMLAAGTEELAISAVQGYIRKTPNRALETLTDPSLAQSEQYGWVAQHIPNEKLQPLIAQAQERVHAQGVEERMARAEERLQLRELSDRTEAKLMEKYGLHMADGKQESLKAMDVVNAMDHEGLDATTGRTILNMLDSDAHQRTAKTDDRTLWQLFDRIHRPYGDPEKLTSTDAIYKAATGRKLEPSKMNFLRNEFVNAQTDEGRKIGETRADFLRGQQANITKANPAMGKLDPEGDTLLANFVYFAKSEEDRFRKENKDPNLLYNPESADYLGKQVPRFQRTLGESIKSFSDKLKKAPGLPKTEQGAPPPDTHRRPGETPKQYLDRIK